MGELYHRNTVSSLNNFSFATNLKPYKALPLLFISFSSYISRTKEKEHSDGKFLNKNGKDSVLSYTQLIRNLI